MLFIIGINQIIGMINSKSRIIFISILILHGVFVDISMWSFADHKMNHFFILIFHVLFGGLYGGIKCIGIILFLGLIKLMFFLQYRIYLHYVVYSSSQQSKVRYFLIAYMQ